MLILIAIIVANLPATACQCMKFLASSETCSDKVSQAETPIVQCIDMCLAQTGGDCYFIEWNRRTRTCYMGRHRWVARYGKGSDCITMKKEMCTSMTDRVCLEDAGGNLFEGGEEVKGLSDGKECSTMCVLTQECLAYTWLERISTCKLHLDKPKRSGERLKEGDMQLKKPRTPRKGRCSIFRAGVNSGNGYRATKNLQHCIRAVSNRKDIVKADWDFWSNDCWYHRGNDAVNMRGTTSNLQLHKMENCILEEKSVRQRKLYNTGMIGGYQIKRASEEACVELCSRMVNCAAVHFYLQSCFFHHEEKPTVTSEHHTLYIFNHRAYETTTVITTTLPTTVTTTTAPIIKSTGTMLWSYYKRYDEDMAEGLPSPVACIECAWMCLRSNCTGFTCGNMTNEDRCNINDISKQRYIPFTP